MTKPAIMFLLSSTVVMAGTVHFNPPSATITPGTQSVSFDVSVSWDTLPTIGYVYAILFSDSDEHLNFTYAQSFLDSMTIPKPIPSETTDWCGAFGCPYKSIDICGGRLPPASSWTSPLLIGTLTLDTSGAMASDQIRVFVDSQFESDTFGAAFSVVQGPNSIDQEVLSGLATTKVVPEATSASMYLLLGGMLWMAGRRMG